MSVPLTIRHHFKLADVGISPLNITSLNVAMQSDRVITCKETMGESEISVIDINNPQPKLGPFKFDSALVHPSRQISAWKTGTTIFIQEMGNSTVIKMYNESGGLEFWKWIDNHTIGYITKTHVYHWTISGDSKPAQVFKRHETLEGCRIVDYQAHADHLLLIGETAQGRGCIQLYNSHCTSRLSTPKNGDAACFVQLKMEGNRHASNILVSSLRNGQGAKLIAEEIGLVPLKNQSFIKQSLDVPFEKGHAKDFPISLQFDADLCVVYIMTQHGFLHLFDVVSGTIFFSTRISNHTILFAVKYSKGGVIALNSEGQVFSVRIDQASMVTHVSKNNAKLATKLARRWNLPDSAINAALARKGDEGEKCNGRKSSKTEEPPKPANDSLEVAPDVADTTVSPTMPRSQPDSNDSASPPTPSASPDAPPIPLRRTTTPDALLRPLSHFLQDGEMLKRLSDAAIQGSMNSRIEELERKLDEMTRCYDELKKENDELKMQHDLALIKLGKLVLKG